ncbi:MAG: hypothetical protein ACM3XZ_10190 [Betaproteobacteria bacterium]
MYKNWLIGILVVLLAVTGYLAYTGQTGSRMLRRDLKKAQDQVARLRPAGTTPAPAEESRAGTQKDPAGSEGCTGCHKKVAPDKDYSIPAELKKIKGHPQPPANASYPKWCTTCHKGGAGVGSLAAVIHKPHLAGATYKKEFDTNCLGCHAVVDGAPKAKGLT